MADRKKDDDFEFFKATKSSKPSFEQRLVYILNGFIVSLIPLYLYLSVFGVDYKTYAPVLIVLSLVSAGAVSITYHDVALNLKNKLLAVRGSVPQKSGKGAETGANKSAVVQARKALQANVITHESIAFSILYNNTIFLLSVIVFAFYVFPGTASVYNYILSVGLSLGLVTLLTSRSVKY